MRTEIEYISAQHKATTGMVIIFDDKNRFVAKVPKDWGTLFAAAPDMLEALKALVEWFPIATQEHGFTAIPECFVRASAVIRQMSTANTQTSAIDWR